MVVYGVTLYLQTQIPQTLYYASFSKYNKKIPIIANTLQVYNKEWLAFSNILTTNENANKMGDTETNINIIEKGIKNDKPFIRMSKDQSLKMNKIGYIYEIIDTDTFLPFPTKNNIYKYFTVKPIKINRVLEVPNILNQLKQLNIQIDLI